MSGKKAKKLVLILVTSISVTEHSKKAILVNAKDLKQMICIQYLIIFQDSLTQVSKALDLISVFLDLKSEVNAIHLIFVKKLGLVMQSTNVGT